MSSMLDSYRRMQEKFGLPHIDKLQAVFQFDLEEDSDIDELRNEISTRLFDFTERVIEPLMWSNQHCHLIERDMLIPSESLQLFEMYKQIQALRWRNNLLALRPTADGTAAWIRDLWSFWRKFEALTSSLCLKFSDGWTNLHFKEVHAEYQG